jgi:hypothetical protein
MTIIDQIVAKGCMSMPLNLRPSTRPLQQTKPRLGMTLAFKPAASEALADIPARVVEIWPRFRSGDYLVKIEYAQPVKCGGEFIRHIDAFLSELYQPRVHMRHPASADPGTTASHAANTTAVAQPQPHHQHSRFSTCFPEHG